MSRLKEKILRSLTVRLQSRSKAHQVQFLIDNLWTTNTCDVIHLAAAGRRRSKRVITIDKALNLINLPT